MAAFYKQILETFDKNFSKNLRSAKINLIRSGTCESPH